MFQPQLTQEALAREAALPENLWIQCPYCKQGSYRESLGENRRTGMRSRYYGS